MEPQSTFECNELAGSVEPPSERPAETAKQPASLRPPWQFSVTDAIAQLLERDPAASAAVLNEVAGLAWSIYQTPAFLFTGDATSLTLDNAGYIAEPQPDQLFKLAATVRRDGSRVPAFTLNVRDDVHQVVGVVKQRYRLFQNDELPRVLERLVDHGEADWVSAGCLRGGAEVWWLVRLKETLTVGGDPRETIEFYLLLTHSHSGAAKTSVAVLPLRVASQTALAWPLKAPRSATLKYRESAAEYEPAAQGLLELARGYRIALEQVAAQMLTAALTDAEFTTFLHRVLPTPKAQVKGRRVVNQRGVTMAESAKGTITQIYYNAPSQEHLTGTLWGAVQAVQFYSDHLTINRNTDDTTADENRFQRITSTGTLGARAFTQALKQHCHARSRYQ